MEERHKVVRKEHQYFDVFVCWIGRISSHSHKPEDDVKQIVKLWDKKEKASNLFYFTRKRITSAISLP